jgi:ribosomal-protein-alanine N-acetyltransferase
MAAVDFELQLAKPDDASALAVLARDLIEAGLGWEYRAPRIAGLISNTEAVSLVARARRRICGFGIMSFGDERSHLVLLAVLPSYQRTGIGRSIIRWLLDSAMVAGVASVHVELRASNRAAHAFYRTLGFEQTLYVPGYYRGREAAVRMLRMLRAPGIWAPRWQPPPRGAR